MELLNKQELPIILRTGKFYKKNGKLVVYSFSKKYNTRNYPVRKFHKPIIF